MPDHPLLSSYQYEKIKHLASAPFSFLTSSPTERIPEAPSVLRDPLAQSSPENIIPTGVTFPRLGSSFLCSYCLTICHGLNHVPLSDLPKFKPPVPVNVTLRRNRVFADVISEDEVTLE